MKKILIVMGSTRPGRAADGVLPAVRSSLEQEGAEVVVADLRALELPFFDSAVIPSDESFTITHESVRAWSQLVSQADGVLVLTPEYNKGPSAVLKNAIDWLFDEWKEKPVALVGYGWSAAAVARDHLNDTFRNLKTISVTPETGLVFMDTINTDGTPQKTEEVAESLRQTVVALLDAC